MELIRPSQCAEALNVDIKMRGPVVKYGETFYSDDPHSIHVPTGVRAGNAGDQDTPPVLHVHLGGTAMRPYQNTPALMTCLMDHGIATVGLAYEWGDFDMSRNKRCEALSPDTSSFPANGSTFSMENKPQLSKAMQALIATHRDVCFGGDDDTVHSSSSIVARLEYLLRYLATRGATSEKSTEAEAMRSFWGNFVDLTPPLSSPSSTPLSKGGAIRWCRIIISGHSQGAGHAAFLAQCFALAHGVFISGPQEGCQDDARFGKHWLDAPFATRSLVAFKHAAEESSNAMVLQGLQRIDALSKGRARVSLPINTTTPMDTDPNVGVWEACDEPSPVLFAETKTEGDDNPSTAPPAATAMPFLAAVGARPRHASTVMDSRYCSLWQSLLLLYRRPHDPKCM